MNLKNLNKPTYQIERQTDRHRQRLIDRPRQRLTDSQRQRLTDRQAEIIDRD